MNKKCICRVAVFLLIFCLCVTYLTDVLMSKWKYPCYESVIPVKFYDLDKNSIEVCVLGSSQVVYGISGMELYSDYGISAYSLGTALQPMRASYNWLQECVKTQDIRLLILDTSMLYEYSDEPRYHQAYDNMRLSISKLKELWKHCQGRDDADPFISYVFKIIKYHTRWSELVEDDFTITSQDLPIFRGNYAYALDTKVDINKIAYDDDEYDSDLQMKAGQLEYFEKIITYCDENDIELLLIKTPKDDWSITKHTQTAEYAEEHNLDFIDFSCMEMIETLGIDADTDFRDNEHLNILGAEKLSRWLGKYLKENYDLTDFREIEGYDDQNYARYCERMEDSRIQVGSDVTEYFKYLDNDRYEVLFQLSAKASAVYTEELGAAMQTAGLATDLSSLKSERYTALLKGGEVLYETTSGENMEYEQYFSDGTLFQTYSNFSTSSTCKMTIDYETQKFSKRGLNILVYDVENHMIVDKSTIYYDEETDAAVISKDNSAVYNAK